MSLVTTSVKFTLHIASGVPPAGLTVRAALTVADMDGGVVVDLPAASGITDSAGACTLALWPNSRGVAGSQYNVGVYQDSVALIHSFLITVPESGSVVLAESIINQAPYPTVDAAQIAITTAQAAVVDAQSYAAAADASAIAAAASAGTASTAATTATTQAGIATAKAVLTAADAVATAADRVQTGLDRTAAAGSASAASTSAGTATTQASTATTQAGIATAQAVLTAADRVQTGLDRTAAAGSASAASGSASTATTQAGISTTKASEASASAAAALASQTAAAGSASAASTSAGTATTQAGVATTQAGNAATSAGAASTSAGAASTSATSASGSATTAGGSATAAAASAVLAAAAVNATGAVRLYDTKALATADLASIPADSIVEIVADESQSSARTRYVKTAGVLVFKLRLPKDIGYASGMGAAARRVKGVLVHIGDSNTNGRPGYRSAYQYEWLGVGGIFEGWTSYNLGQNGSILADWATTEVANCDNPTYSSLPPADYNGTDPNAGRLARAINANPDVIVLSLGTNDLNSPVNRASIGVEATLRTNLATLIGFLLARTRAGILLRMPQPFAHEDFSGITGWVDAAECAEASRRLRQVYSEWIGVNPRVEVYHSHQALFGNSCDNKAVNAQDPFGSGALISDSLHPSDLGYRRLCQQVAVQLNPAYPRSPIITIEPFAIPKDAVWSCTLQHRTTVALVGGTSAVVEMDFSPSAVLASSPAELPSSGGSSQPNTLAKASIVALSGKIAKLTAFRELLAVPKKNKVFAYSHATGVTVALTAYGIAQIVTAASPHYVQLTVQAANLAGFGGGAVTFYVTDPSAIPYTSPNVTQTSLITAGKAFFLPKTGGSFSSGSAQRKPTGSSPVVSIYLQNQADGRYVTSETFAAPGKLVGTFTWGAWGNYAAFVFDPTNYPSGSFTSAGTTEFLWAAVTTGSISTDFNNNVEIYLTL